MVYESIVDCIGRTPLVHLQRLFPQDGIKVIAKLELLNPGGSVKDRPARHIIQHGLQDKSIVSDTMLVESSSGNFGIALAMVARIYGLKFTCVVDPKIANANLVILRELGALVDMVTEPDDQGGYLKTRIRRVQELLSLNPNTLWVNQYANKLNWQAHYYNTAEEILEQLDGPVDYVVVAVSTTGTILGLSRKLREAFPQLRVVAVDAVGSVIFGGPPGPRELPGIGSSRVPELLVREEVDSVEYVSDWEAVQGCHELLRYEGVLGGGSSGSVIAAIKRMIPGLTAPTRLLTLLPDRGERYLDTVYNEDWIETVRYRIGR